MYCCCVCVPLVWACLRLPTVRDLAVYGYALCPSCAEEATDVPTIARVFAANRLCYRDMQLSTNPGCAFVIVRSLGRPHAPPPPKKKKKNRHHHQQPPNAHIQTHQHTSPAPTHPYTPARPTPTHTHTPGPASSSLLLHSQRAARAHSCPRYRQRPACGARRQGHTKRAVRKPRSPGTFFHLGVCEAEEGESNRGGVAGRTCVGFSLRLFLPIHALFGEELNCTHTHTHTHTHNDAQAPTHKHTGCGPGRGRHRTRALEVAEGVARQPKVHGFGTAQHTIHSL